MLDKLQLTKYKATAALAVMGVLPTAADKVAVGYHHVYEMSSGYASQVRDAGMAFLGYERIQTAKALDDIIQTEALRYNINPALLRALIKTESAHNLDAYSPKGAIGLAQIMPANARRCGHSSVSKLWDESNNIRCGAQILSEELKTYKGDLDKALQSYNAGPKGVNNYPGAKHYALTVMKRFAQFGYKAD